MNEGVRIGSPWIRKDGIIADLVSRMTRVLDSNYGFAKVCVYDAMCSMLL